MDRSGLMGGKVEWRGYWILGGIERRVAVEMEDIV